MAFKNLSPKSEKQKPVRTIRSGCVSAAIWERDGTNGKFFSVTVQRSYKPADSEEWKYTDSFGRDDLLLAAKLLDQAHTFIMRKEAEAHDQKGD